LKVRKVILARGDKNARLPTYPLKVLPEVTHECIDGRCYHREYMTQTNGVKVETRNSIIFPTRGHSPPAASQPPAPRPSTSTSRSHLEISRRRPDSLPHGTPPRAPPAFLHGKLHHRTPADSPARRRSGAPCAPGGGGRWAGAVMAWAPPATRRPPVPSCSRSRPQRIHRPRGAERRPRLCEETTAFFPGVSSTRISEGGGVLRVHVCTAGGASHPFLASPARSSYRCPHTPNPVGCGEEVERAGRAGAFSSPVPVVRKMPNCRWSPSAGRFCHQGHLHQEPVPSSPPSLAHQ
jgi:hypothetical protein